MAMVSNKFLAALAVRLGFHKHLRCGGAVIEVQNREFVKEVKEAEEEAKGVADYWTSTKSPPKVDPLSLLEASIEDSRTSGTLRCDRILHWGCFRRL